MSLAVIGSGFGRTGTMSLKVALDRLGCGPCHHMEDFLGTPAQLPGWQAAASGAATDWEAVFAGYRAQVDWPGSHFWRELVVAFPRARVIHTIRPVDAWWKSYSTTIGTALLDYERSPAKPRLDVAAKIIKAELGGSLTDREAAVAAFHRRTEEVTRTVPRERLLVFDVAEGWAPLCRFLDLPVPEASFPRLYSSADFWADMERRRNAAGKPG
jgi:hypothetical protein